MERPSPWVLITVLLMGLVFLREPRLQRGEETFLRWLLRNAPPPRTVAPLTIVEIGGEPILRKGMAQVDPTEKFFGRVASPNAPLEPALLLQAALDFKPSLIAFESVLKWGDREKDVAQIFVDQALRVPKLVVGAELTTTPDPDAPVPEIPVFTQVKGRRSELIEFSGIAQQPNEDVRLIGTLGFVNLPEELGPDIHLPLLFQYRGEVIPSFALQTALLWLRVPLNEVKIEIGSNIKLPNGTKIPIRSDGTLLINPGIVRRQRHITLNELLLAAQRRETHEGATGSNHLDDMQNHVVLARAATSSTPEDPFAAGIAAIQSRSFLRRISWLFDCAAILIAAAVSGTLRRFSRTVLILAAVAFSAGYCLMALAIVSRWSIWLPGLLPLGAVWISVLFAIVLPKPHSSTARRPPSGRSDE